MNNFNLHIYQKTESTNMLVKNRIDAGEREGYAALAFEQSAGYGRMKRAWASPAGGLYLSVLLRPSVRVQVMPTISFLVALSVRRALLRFLPGSYSSRIKLKWPNDIVLSDSLDNSCAEENVCAEDAAVESLKYAQECTCAEENVCAEDAAVDAAASAIANGRTGINMRTIAQTVKPEHQFRKLVGISQELIHGALCVGIGANVFRPSIPQNITGKNTPVYIEDIIKCASLESISTRGTSTRGISTENAVIDDVAIDNTSTKAVPAKNSPIKTAPAKTQEKQDYIVELARTVLEELQPLYREWCARGFEPFVEEYQQHMCLVGSRVQMNNQLGNCVLEGEVVGIDSDGCILVKHAEGITHQPSGEVSLLPAIL